MDPAVRSARTQSAIITVSAEDRNSRRPERGITGLSSVVLRSKSSRSKNSRGERNFWMQRPEAENRLERPLMPTETERRNDTGEYPRRNGLIGVSVEFCGLGRLDGGDGRDRTANPPTQSSNSSLTPESGTEIFDAETGAQKPPFRLLETDAETRRDSKGPRRFGGIQDFKIKPRRSGPAGSYQKPNNGRQMGGIRLPVRDF